MRAVSILVKNATGDEYTGGTNVLYYYIGDEDCFIKIRENVDYAS
jgi:hypothetical protein